MSRNFLYLTIGVLIVVVSVIGYQLYQEWEKSTGVEINFDKSGLSIEKH